MIYLSRIVHIAKFIHLKIAFYISIIFLLISCKGKVEHATFIALKSNATSHTQFEANKVSMANDISVIFQDSQNRYWFSSKTMGLYLYDPAQENIKSQAAKIIHYTTKDGLPSNNLGSVQEDQYGHIYIMTDLGISKFDGDTFTTLKINTDTSFLHWKLDSGDVWFKGFWGSGGPFRYDGTSLFALKLPKHELEDQFNLKYPEATYSPYDVYCIYKDSKGHIWIGTSTFGACHYDGNSFSWLSDDDMHELHDGPAPGVRSIMEDQDGYFWFSNNICHKYQLIKDHQTINSTAYSYRKQAGIDTLLNTEMNHYFNAFTQDRNGHFWMASYAMGVWKYDGENITHYPVKNPSNEVLIYTIYADKDGKIWLGTSNTGVYTFNGLDFQKWDLSEDNRN